MTLLDHGQSADTTTKKHHTGLIAVLAVLAVALLAAGEWLFVDRQQQPLSAEEQVSSTEQPLLTAEQQQTAIMEVVTAHNEAINAQHRDALRATLTDDFTWARADYIIDAKTYAGVWTFGNGTQESFTGDPVFTGDLQVAIPTHREPGGVWEDGTPVVMDGTYIFTLREVDGQLKIATIVFNEES